MTPRMTTQTTIPGVADRFQQQFKELAANPAKFHEVLAKSFGPNFDKAAAEGIRQQAVQGDFSWMPRVRFLSDAEMKGAQGGYDNATGTVLLNSNLANSPDLAATVFSEEAGHHLDNVLNHGVDSPGDEGEIFGRLLGGEKLGDAT
ncbi:MAG: hypothetical protein JNM63_19480, partial [Spirochaetia bacterium]|nr:hypothetical protein [Spirochaetia bacterium]